MRTAKVIALWLCGLLAGAGGGGLLEQLQGSYTGWGALSGALAFATARLWYDLSQNSN